MKAPLSPLCVFGLFPFALFSCCPAGSRCRTASQTELHGKTPWVEKAMLQKKSVREVRQQASQSGRGLSDPLGREWQPCGGCGIQRDHQSNPFPRAGFIHSKFL